MKPSVLLADDDETFRDLSREFLGTEFRVVASVGDGQALIDAAHALGPDLVITDISMPVLNGFQAIRQLKSVQPDARVIFLTAHGNLAFVAEARRMNALGYVLKRSVASDLIPAIREALEGRFFVSPAVLQ